jgi:TPR repeat protein
MQLSFRALSLLATLISLPIFLIAADPLAPVVAPSNGSSAPVHRESEATTPPQSDPSAEKFWHALKLLRGTKPADLAAGRAELKAASDLGYTHAQVLLGNCLLAGSYGMNKEPRKAVALFRLASERGNAFAKVSLGQCYASGTGVRRNMAKATDALNAALAPGADFSRPIPPADFFAQDATSTSGGVAGDLEHDPVIEAQTTAHFLLGLIDEQEKKLVEAQNHFLAAASAGPGGRDGIYLAALHAAINYAFGFGTARDLPKAHEMLDQSRKLAGRMNVSMIHNYVALKIVDEFATEDLEESLEKAGENNEMEIILQIASAFAYKKSPDYNITEAVKWYELAAETGQARAMISLGFIYSEGDLGPPDRVKAFAWFEKVGGGDKPKLFLGSANLAICYLHGIGTEANPGKAAAIFKLNRDRDILCYLGTIGQCPDHITPFEQELALNETWAKEKNDPHAQFLLGLRYLHGAGYRPDIKDASRWIKKAALANDAAALGLLGLLYEENGPLLGKNTEAEAWQAAAESYRAASALGDTDAMANFAMMLKTGKGVARNPEKAEEQLLACLQAEPDHARAHCTLGALYSDRLAAALTEKNSEAVTKWRTAMNQHYDEGIRLKFPVAAQDLGTLYLAGKLVEQDYRRAYAYFDQAAEWGLKRAHYQIGQMHELGQGVPVTYAEAAYHYRLAALAGHSEALLRLVDFYESGKGVPRDLDRAIYWISILARKEEEPVLIRLADLQLQNQNYDTARTLFSKLARSTNPEHRGSANQRLSALYAHGWGVAEDQKQAKKYREKALRDDNLPALHDSAMALITAGKKAAGIELLGQAVGRGLPNSKYELGRLCLYGDGVPKDSARGLKLLNEAAERGYEDAEITLATLTLENTPGAPDLETAIQLASNAAASGHEKANELREKLEARRKNNAVPDDTAKARSS